MAQWRIELKNVGPEKACGTTLADAQDLIKAKVHAMRECRRHLACGNIYLEAMGQYRYLVICDMDEVGEVQLTRLDTSPDGRSRRRQIEESKSLK